MYSLIILALDILNIYELQVVGEFPLTFSD